ncbi:hypothetical protein, partial [Helicobacter ganmani]|uniref:hypothetical protein n=1 Tax=Helicobacter ganmani TaxID=60246 RepID=UPI003A878CF3
KNGFREEQQQQIKTCFDASQGAIRYNFISFNYTKTLDKCIELSKNNSFIYPSKNLKQNKISYV